MTKRVELLQTLSDAKTSVAARPPWRAVSYYRLDRLHTWLLEDDEPGGQLVVAGLFAGARIRVTREDNLLGLWRSLGEIELDIPELDDAWAIEGAPRVLARAVLRSAPSLRFLATHVRSLRLAGGLLEIELSILDEHAITCCHELVEALLEPHPGAYVRAGRAPSHRSLRRPPALESPPKRPILEIVRDALTHHEGWAEREEDTVRAEVGLAGFAGKRADADLMVLCFPNYVHATGFELRLSPRDPPGPVLARSLEPEEDESPVTLQRLHEALDALVSRWESSVRT